MSESAQSQGQWTPNEASPAAWLTLLPDGDFRIGTTAFRRDMPVQCQVKAVRVTKDKGDGQALLLTRGEKTEALLYWHGQWLRWQQTPTAVPAPPAGVPAGEQPMASAAVAEPAPATPAPKKPAPRWAGFLAPLVLLLLMAIVSVLGNRAFGFAAVRSQCQLDDQTWMERGAVHTLVTHPLLALRWEEGIYTAAGILLFGWLVQRNVGPWRTLLLFFWSAAFSVGMWCFLQTQLGQAVLADLVGKVLRWMGENLGWDSALAALAGYDQVYDRLLDLRGPVAGATAAVSGLMMFAVCRRRFYASRWPFKLPELVLSLVYLGIGWLWLWPAVLSTPTPYLLFVGGAVGGWVFCFPDKALYHFGDSLKNVWLNREAERSS
jgi:membrane associated rhomboid family serine protease